MLLLGHVDTIDDDGYVRKFLLFCQAVDESEAFFGRVIGTAHVNCGVSHTSYLQRVGDETNRSSVDENVIIFLFQLVDDDVE